MKIEIRSDSEVRVSGYVNAVERRSSLLPKEKGEDAPGDFIEMIRAGTFADSLQRLPRVELRFNHGKVIGVTGVNLKLAEDSIGLHAEAEINDPETVKAARAGLLRGWSFGMKNAHGEYVRSGAVYERCIDHCDLLEVSLLTNRPAYPATSVELRDGEALETRSGFDLPEVSAADMEKINSCARRELKPEEVYVFPAVLCGNKVDRDGERFSLAALETMSKLFAGRTVISDHEPRSSNQKARIISCELVTHPEELTEAGEPYTQLIGRAYMMRTEENKGLIAEIDGGIRKEVSVSCAVRKRLCSVCGANVLETACGHIPGRIYDGKRCHRILDEPTDAYEISFVAIPAQPDAGVTREQGFNESPEEIRSKLDAVKREIEILKLKGKMYND